MKLSALGEATTGVSLKAWWIYLLTGMLAAGAYSLLSEAFAREVLYILVSSGAAVAVVAGILVHRPRWALPWWLISGGLVLFVAGDLVWSFYEWVLGVESPFPSVADFLYLLAYPLIASGLAAMIWQRAPGRERGSLIDAALVAVGVGVLSWVFLMAPYADDPSLTLAERVISVSY
ncbi:MAG: hypothetical protein AB1425_05110, partial [Actinomycetota bacterium]